MTRTGWIEVHLCLRKSGCENSNRFLGPGPEWAFAIGILECEVMLRADRFLESSDKSYLDEKFRFLNEEIGERVRKRGGILKLK